MDVPLFEQVGEAVQSLLPQVQVRAHRRGIKVWVGGESPTREHFEAQVMPRHYLDGTDGRTIEVGFHAEHKEPERNLAVVDLLEKKEKKWRRALGAEAEIGVFFGAPDWRRVSEVWIEPDLDDPELAFEIAARLVDYVAALEPVLSTGGSNT